MLLRRMCEMPPKVESYRLRRKHPFNMRFHPFPWCSGYHVRLTRARSPARSGAKTEVFLKNLFVGTQCTHTIFFFFFFLIGNFYAFPQCDFRPPKRTDVHCLAPKERCQRPMPAVVSGLMITEITKSFCPLCIQDLLF